MPLAQPGTVAAHYTDSGEPCIISVVRLGTRPPRNAFLVDGEPVQLLSPDFCEDRRRTIRADEAGAFGGFG
jgi:hypothetical protein